MKMKEKRRVRNNSVKKNKKQVVKDGKRQNAL